MNNVKRLLQTLLPLVLITSLILLPWIPQTSFASEDPSECSVTRSHSGNNTGRYDLPATCFTDSGWTAPVAPDNDGNLETSTAYDYDSPYYLANWGWHHGAVDLVGPLSSPYDTTTSVYAIGDGTIRYIVREDDATENDSRLHIEHTSVNGTKFLAIYGHTYAANNLSVNSTVFQGQQIGTLRVYGSPVHLHFELNTLLTTTSYGAVKTGTVNPLQYLIDHPASPSTIELSFVTLYTQKFPLIYLTVRASSDGQPVSDLTKDNFSVTEDGRLQTDMFDVVPPQQSGGVRMADIVFLIDNSGSMSTEIAAVKNNCEAFADALVASEIDYRLGLVQFGQYANGGHPRLMGSGLTANVTEFKSWVATMPADGGSEYGFEAIRLAILSYSFRPASQKVFILITDEDSDDRDKQTTIDMILANDVTVHVAAYCSGTAEQDYCGSGSVRDVSGGLQFPVTGDYRTILDTIGESVANTYVVRYRTDNPVFDGLERTVVCTVHDGPAADSVQCKYIPGGAPYIRRTEQTLALHEQSLVASSSPTISVEVTDAAAPFVEGVFLYVRTSGSGTGYVQISMLPQGNDTYSIAVPGSYVNSPGLDYYIRATDGQVTSWDPMTDPDKNPYQIAVLPNEAPVITHTAPSSWQTGNDVSLNIDASDNTYGIASLSVYFRKYGDLLWQSVEMNYDPPTTFINENIALPVAAWNVPAIEYYIEATDDLKVSSLWPRGGADVPYLLGATCTVNIFDIQAVFTEETVFYNPLLPPDSVYVYYLVDYTADSQCFEVGSLVSSSEHLPFLLTNNNNAVEVTSCRVYGAFTEDTAYEAILQFEVPFSTTQTDYTLDMAGFSIPVSVVPERRDISVEDELTSYMGVGAGLSFPKFKFTLLGNKVEGQLGPSLEGEIGRTSGYESEITYSGDGASNDYLVFGFPHETSVEGELKCEVSAGAKSTFNVFVVDANLVEWGTSIEGYVSNIQYPIKANLEENKYHIAAFIVPICANTLTPQTNVLLNYASLLPFDVYSPYKEIWRRGFTLVPTFEMLTGEIAVELLPGTDSKGAKFEGSVFEVGGEYTSTWDDGQEDSEAIDTYSMYADLSWSVLNFKNLDLSLLAGEKARYEKHGQIGNDKYFVESGYLDDTALPKMGQHIYINRWEMNEDDFSKLSDDGSISLNNLPRLYETDTIVGIKLYQSAPPKFYMDVAEIELGLGLGAKAIWRIEVQGVRTIPAGTSYASNGRVYEISSTGTSTIEDKLPEIKSYTKDSVSVLLDSLGANLEAVTELVKKAILGLATEIESIINSVADTLVVYAKEAGTKIVEVTTQAAGAVVDFGVTVWEGFFNPPAAINNANLDFASQIIVIDREDESPVPADTTVTIYPKDGLSIDDLSDVGVYKFTGGYWTIVPALMNTDGSFTFILRSTGIYALIHRFPNDSDCLNETLVNMGTNSSHTLTSSPVRNSDGSMAMNSSFNITLTKAAVVSTNGTTMTLGESPVVFPSVVETDSSGQLSIPIHSGDLEGEAYLQIKANSGYCAQTARIIVSEGDGIDGNFTVAIKMVSPTEGMAVVNQDVELEAITNYSAPDVHWNIMDSFANEQYAGSNITFDPVHSGVYSVYCFAKDENGFTHTAYAALPVTDPTNDTDGDGISDDLEYYYGSDPSTPDSDELYEAMEGNRPPIADAGGTYEGSEDSPVTFSALASFDLDGDPLRYRWDFGNDGLWDTEFSLDPVAHYTWGDSYSGIVNLEVTDGELSSTDAASVTVVGSPRPSGSSPGGGTAVTSYLTIDWDNNTTQGPLDSNARLTTDLLGSSPDGSHSLLLQQGTHAPTVNGETHYLIAIRDLEEVPPLPENTATVVAINITPSGAVFDRDVVLTLAYDELQLPANTESVIMAHYDDSDGLWETLQFEVGEQSGVAEQTLSAPINHFSIYGILAELTPTPPAHFVPSDLRIEPSVERTVFETRTGESVAVTANIGNGGGEEGTYDVVLKLNGQTVDTKTVTVSAGQTKQVSFAQSGLDYGHYDVEVAGLTGEFTASRVITWWLIVLAVVAIGLIVWGVVWGTRRRRRAAQEG